MLLTLTTNASENISDATDLGYLLHKHPDKVQSFPVSGGTAQVFWPVATAERSTVALLLEIDPIALVRGRGHRGADGFALSHYVNDRPYAASSMLAVALGKVFRTAMSGRCDARPELAGRPLPLQVHLPALPSRAGVDLVERFFGPLGWTVAATSIALDPQLPDWGASAYLNLRLTGTLPVCDALTQLYVLIPALDDSKHYWIGADEVQKLMRAAGSWLSAHPERDLIASRYLGHHRTLVRSAVDRLAEIDDAPPETAAPAGPEEPVKAPTPLARLRQEAVIAALKAAAASRVVDLGCGEGALRAALIPDPSFSAVLGVDVSPRALERAARRLQLDRLPDTQRGRLELIQSSVTYRDDRMAGYDAVVLMEVIEHLDLARLPALVRAVFAHARPISVLVTTPNAEYNVRYEGLPTGTMRHRDHRFEWTRYQFRDWADATAAGHGYQVRYLPIGEDDPEVGSPTQLAVFRRTA